MRSATIAPPGAGLGRLTAGGADVTVPTLALALNASDFPDDRRRHGIDEATGWAVQGVALLGWERLAQLADDERHAVEALNAATDRADRRERARAYRQIWPTLYRRDRCTVQAIRLADRLGIRYG